MDWKNNQLKDLKKLDHKKNYKFFISDTQKKSLELQFKKNKSKNINSILRDMTVYSDGDQFFYDVSHY